jgi:hypothetical protein
MRVLFWMLLAFGIFSNQSDAKDLGAVRRTLQDEDLDIDESLAPTPAPSTTPAPTTTLAPTKIGGGDDQGGDDPNGEGGVPGGNDQGGAEGVPSPAPSGESDTAQPTADNTTMDTETPTAEAGNEGDTPSPTPFNEPVSSEPTEDEFPTYDDYPTYDEPTYDEPTYGQPTYPTYAKLPTQKPAAEYIPPPDDLDPNQPLQPSGGDKEWHNESIEEIEHDRNVIIALSVVGALGFLLTIITAHQMLENPDGWCARYVLFHGFALNLGIFVFFHANNKSLFCCFSL